MKNNVKTAVIIGGSRGIGSAVTQLLANEGYKVFFTFNSSENQARHIEKNLSEKGLFATAVKCNVQNKADVDNLFDMVAVHKPIDTVVINAGIAIKNMITSVTDEEFNALIDTNIRGAFYAARRAASDMMWSRQGNIVFVSSVLGQDGCSCESVYSFTKGGINAFSKSLAKELGQFGIRVNTVCPGLIDTDMNSNLTQEEKEEIIKNIPLRRIGKPIDVANAILFLAQSNYITASELVVSGGASF